MATRILLVAAIVVACAHSLAVAQEIATDAERTYRELRSAKDARTRLLGERWNNLIRLQEWNDATGKFATTAKYVEHDPELQWVKLRMIKGTGANRVVKDVTIPVAKLSKTCQSRVRQISVLRDKVADAAVEAAKAKEADAAEIVGQTDEAGQQDLAELAVDEASFDGERATGPPQPDIVPAGERPPLPARLPPLPAGPIGPSNPPAENISAPPGDDSHR